MEKYKFLIPIALMAAIIGGLIWIGNQDEVYTPSEEVTPSTHHPNNHRKDWQFDNTGEKG